MYGLSFYAMTFDLGPRSKVKMVFLWICQYLDIKQGMNPLFLANLRAIMILRRPGSVCLSVCLLAQMCARRFLRNCQVEFDKTWYNTYIIAVLDAHPFIIAI